MFDNANAAVSVLHVEKGGYSSRHFHRERINRFIVVSGEILVETYSTPERLETRNALTAGDVLDVQPNVIHRFSVVESGIVVEVYWPSAHLSLEDIVRLDEGGS